MIDFTISKNGYDVVQVDNYLVKLKASYENQLQEQKDRIFDQKRIIEQLSQSSEGELMAQLLKSVERARQIEISSQNIYELETKRLQLFYSKMESVVEEITTNQDCREIKRRLTALINEFKEVLNENITIQKKAVSDMEHVDPVQRLLSKMSSTNVKLREFVPTTAGAAKKERLTSTIVENTASAAMRRQVEENKEKSNTQKSTRKEETKQTSSQQTQTSARVYKEDIKQSGLEIKDRKQEALKQESVKTQQGTQENKDIIITKTGVIRERLKGVEVGSAVVSEKMSATVVKNAENKDEVVVDTTVETYRKSLHDDEQHIDSTKMVTTYGRASADVDGMSVGYKPKTTVETNTFSSSSSLSLSETPKEISVDKTVATKVNDGPVEIESRSAHYDKKSGAHSAVSHSTIKPLINTTTIVTEPTESTTKKTVKTEQETIRKLGSLLEDDKVSGTNFESIMFKKSDQKVKNSVIGAKLTYPTPNESGFDLKEAVNPKDDLEEIMRAFDFYDEDTTKGKKKK